MNCVPFAVTALAQAIVKRCTAEQAEQTAAVLTQLGDTITTFLITEQTNPDSG